MRIAPELLDEIVEHARRDAPNECCGVVAVRDGVAEAVHPMENTAASPFRFEVDGLELHRLLDRDRGRRRRARGDLPLAHALGGLPLADRHQLRRGLARGRVADRRPRRRGAGDPLLPDRRRQGRRGRRGVSRPAAIRSSAPAAARAGPATSASARLRDAAGLRRTWRSPTRSSRPRASGRARSRSSSSTASWSPWRRAQPGRGGVHPGPAAGGGRAVDAAPQPRLRRPGHARRRAARRHGPGRRGEHGARGAAAGRPAAGAARAARGRASTARAGSPPACSACSRSSARWPGPGPSCCTDRAALRPGRAVPRRARARRPARCGSPRAASIASAAAQRRAAGHRGGQPGGGAPAPPPGRRSGSGRRTRVSCTVRRPPRIATRPRSPSRAAQGHGAGLGRDGRDGLAQERQRRAAAWLAEVAAGRPDLGQARERPRPGVSSPSQPAPKTAPSTGMPAAASAAAASSTASASGLPSPGSSPWASTSPPTSSSTTRSQPRRAAAAAMPAATAAGPGVGSTSTVGSPSSSATRGLGEADAAGAACVAARRARPRDAGARRPASSSRRRGPGSGSTDAALPGQAADRAGRAVGARTARARRGRRRRPRRRRCPGTGRAAASASWAMAGRGRRGAGPDQRRGAGGLADRGDLLGGALELVVREHRRALEGQVARDLQPGAAAAELVADLDGHRAAGCGRCAAAATCSGWRRFQASRFSA